MRLGKPGVNYYNLLGVSSTATQDEIKKAFRERILQVHLDKMAPDEDTEICYLTIEANRILSDKTLRQKYDVERSSSKEYKAGEERFIPAGYICYDVGHQQMSRQLLDNISSWSREYSGRKGELEDNYFHCFQQIMEQVGAEDEETGRMIMDTLDSRESYYCPVCDRRFVSETQHWDMVINPYTGIFFSDQQGVPALMQYFEGLIGSDLFNWEVR